MNNYPFLIQENFFISLLIRSNEGLIKLAKKYGFSYPELYVWQEKSLKSFRDKFWDVEAGMFYPYDFNKKALIKKDILGALISLFAGIPNKEQANALVNKIEKSFIPNEAWFLCPSYSAKAEDFDPKKYWRGPLWPNVNWLLYHGLKRYGFDTVAVKIKEQTIYLIEHVGMYEYFDPRPLEESPLEQKGLGGQNFSWTAAIYLDFKNNSVIL
jgi:neutral trehalase